MPMPMSARGGNRGESKASSPDASTFMARLPLSRVSPNKRVTSGMPPSAATSRAPMKFCRPSLRMRAMGICEPVTTTGLPNDGSRNDRADDV